MSRTRVRWGAITILCGLMGACGLPPMVSDTGWQGTWSRRSPGGSSILAIAFVDGRWYSRFLRREADGSHSILCDWDGRCEERMKDKLVATYTITTSYDAATRTLSTETVEERSYPSKKTARYREEFEVSDGGRTLKVFTTDRDGQHLAKGAAPGRTFTKLADSVADPPRGLLRR